MSEARSWVVTDKADGQEVCRCYDATRDEVLKSLAVTYGDDWAYGTDEFPSRFKVEPIEEPHE